MKKICVLAFLALFSPTMILAQSCLPEGITFYSQAGIDNFQANYPGCTEIEGDVTIGYDGYQTDITNLDGLSVLTAIGGFLYINTNENLVNFSGLDALETIGGDFTVEDNDLITNFTGLGGLTWIGGDFYVIENDNLANFSGLNALTTITGLFEMGHNLTFSALTGLEALTTTGGLKMNYIHNMPTMEGLSALSLINGDLLISSCHGLTSFAGLTLLQEVTGVININENIGLESVSGLEALTTVGGGLMFGNNNLLTSLAGLINLSEIGGSLTIGGSDLLPDLDGLESLTTIGGQLQISGNNQLISIDGIDGINAQTIGSLEIRYNPMLSECDVKSVCDYLQIPGGIVNIMNNASGCNSESEVETACGTPVQEEAAVVGFAIHPNPANNNIILTFPENFVPEAISVYTLTGRKVLSWVPSGNSVDVSEINRGIYILEVTASGKVLREKLVIQ